MNPFQLLESRMRESRTGHVPTDALMLLAPYWAEEHQPDDRQPKVVILEKIDSLPDCKLTRAMKSTIQSMPL